MKPIAITALIAALATPLPVDRRHFPPGYSVSGGYCVPGPHTACQIIPRNQQLLMLPRLY